MSYAAKIKAASPFQILDVLGKVAYQAGRDLDPAEHVRALDEMLEAVPAEARDAARVKGLQALARGAKRRALSVVSADDAPVDARPIIRIRKGDGYDHGTDAIRALSADPHIYRRQGKIVHVVGAAEWHEGDRVAVAAGSPTIQPMAQATLWERASKWIRWEKWDGRRDAYAPDDPPLPVLAAVMARASYPGFREIEGVLEHPALAPSGGIIWDGYDPETRFLCIPSMRFDPPTPEPTQADAAAALGELREVYEQFYHRTENEKMVPVASILTMLARPAIRGACPIFIFDGSVKGAGKTLQADAAITIATGRIPPPTGYPDDAETLEKVLGALAVMAPAAVKWDNLVGRFGGGQLDAVTTARDTYQFRILGQSKMADLPWRSVQFATGNNIQLRGDTGRRCLIARSEPDIERPEEREDLKHDPLLPWVIENRARLVRAALTVLRAWVVAGRPRMGCANWGGGFEAWSAIIPPAIVFAGGADPLHCRPAVTGDEEPEREAVDQILRGLQRLDENGNGLTTKAILDLLYAPDRLKGQGVPDGFDEMRDGIEALVTTKEGQRPHAKTLGERLDHYGKGRIINGRRLKRARAEGKVSKWIVEKA